MAVVVAFLQFILHNTIIATTFRQRLQFVSIRLTHFYQMQCDQVCTGAVIIKEVYCVFVFSRLLCGQLAFIHWNLYWIPIPLNVTSEKKNVSCQMSVVCWIFTWDCFWQYHEMYMNPYRIIFCRFYYVTHFVCWLHVIYIYRIDLSNIINS